MTTTIKKQFLLCVILLMTIGCTSKEPYQYDAADINIIPKPKTLLCRPGAFEFTEKTRFVINNKEEAAIAEMLIQKFSTATGWTLTTTETIPAENYVAFTINKALKKEAYEIAVAEDHIVLTAGEASGFLYAIQSLRQLLPPEIETKGADQKTKWLVPAVSIKDEPRFQWRGLMLDISRHFFGKEYIKEVIDGLAFHKMNVLHLHLVDDQGWRIEIKKYPRLTTVGAWRVDQEDKHWNDRRAVSPDEKGTYGGFLTQEELKEIVAYADKKNITVIPEIEMPAHVSSAIAAYPHLSCKGNSIGVPSGGLWPITDIYCAGQESTFVFLEDVLKEVMDIFPSQYIHIGGDEATKTNWEHCPYCRQRMKDEGLSEVEELQSYFIKRIEKFINAHGKKLIGWDEILEGGLAPDATVMSWRGVKGGLEAAAQGHDVVMTPGTHCYFDHYQGKKEEEPLAIGGFTPLSKVYQFDPVVPSMTAEAAKHVLGGQANLWSEYITTTAHSQYMIYPRLAALAETVWSPKEARDWGDFSDRIQTMFDRYEYQGIHYAKSSFRIRPEVIVDTSSNSVTLQLKNEYPNADIRYVLGTDTLSEKAIQYTKPIPMDTTITLTASLFKNNKAIGTVLKDTIVFHKAVGNQVSYVAPYHKKYKGTGTRSLVNAIRGSKNFGDGQWQAWLGNDMEVIIDLGKEQAIHKTIVGSMQDQGNGIYYPVGIEVFTSLDGTQFTKKGQMTRKHQLDRTVALNEFDVTFETHKTRYVKVKATSIKEVPHGGDVWLFTDEILIE
ncbi:family 20 glycosylhydrolase [Aquimarina hainanensis]|uniref:beta-N-acetylhexosaminidase n=1 Tax=Aquimarina hainanensis TaxID=1578017 RepID=A0ABW5NBB5_9FLAO